MFEIISDFFRSSCRLLSDSFESSRTIHQTPALSPKRDCCTIIDCRCRGKGKRYIAVIVDDRMVMRKVGVIARQY